MSSLAHSDSFRPTHLELPDGIAFEQWMEMGEVLAGIHRALGWWVGDWYNEGERRWGDRAAAAAMMGIRPETLSNYAHVARAIPPSRRRRKVSFSTHALVASLPPRERDEWLKRIEDEGLSGTDVRQLLRESGGVDPGPQPQWSNAAATVSPREALEEVKRRVPELETVVRPALAALDVNPPTHRCPRCGFEWRHDSFRLDANGGVHEGLPGEARRSGDDRVRLRVRRRCASCGL